MSDGSYCTPRPRLLARTPICPSRRSSPPLRLRFTDRERDKEAASIKWQETGLLFTTKYGTPVEPRNFDRVWHRRIAKATVPRITVHDGRHTCGSILADLDVHPRVAMASSVTPSSPSPWEIYTEVSDAATREGLRKLGDNLT